MDLARRRLIRVSAGLLAGGAALANLPAYARKPRREPTPTADPEPTPDVEPTPTATPTPGPAALEPLPGFVRPREAWAAAPPARPYVPHVPSAVVVHHTGSVYTGRVPVEPYLRGIQAFHVGPEREWEDIAYHFFVDLEGGVWAGRPPEVRGNPSVYYDALGLVLICFLGDYGVQAVSEAQLASACATAAWIIRRYRLPPDALLAHRDKAPTACPGAGLYQLVQDGTLGSRVRALL